MTVTYTAEVATCRGFGCFLKLLFRWRGSIYKLVWLDLFGFLLFYYILNITYRTVLGDSQKRIFEGIVQYCATYSNLIPLSFVLGFYVAIVMTRWWNQYTSIPWPDSIAVFVSANVHGQDERGRVMRRTLMRYVCLCLTMVLSNVSPRVKKRFPSLDNLVEAGLLVENEKKIIEKLNMKFPRHSKHWLPIVWAASIVTRARKEGRIRDDFAVKTVIDELNKFRGQCGLLISYDTISIPLVYTQVVTLAVYSFFLTSVMGQQWVENKEVSEGYLNTIDLYFPIFTTLQFFFYMGWLKVAESLINPFGDDDDDFEVNWMVDRNLQVSYLIVDEMHHEHPELIKDQYWDEIFPNELPYTVASEPYREEHPEPSTAKIEVPKSAAITSNLSSIKVDEMVGKNKRQTVNYKFPENDEEADDAISGIHFTVDNDKLRERHSSLGSSQSIVSITSALSRVNTAASALKRFFSRDEGRQVSTTPNDIQSPFFTGSASSSSLGAGNKMIHGGGSIRITDQIIEEVDEQLTTTSVKGNEQNRPNVREIFQQSSVPLDVPYKTNRPYIRTQSALEEINKQSNTFTENDDILLSLSAPDSNRGFMPSKSNIINKINKRDQYNNGEIAKNEEHEIINNPEEVFDDFEKFRIERAKERIERQKYKIVRSISAVPVIIATENSSQCKLDELEL